MILLIGGFWSLSGCVHHVDIAVVGAQIAPTMANGAAWDGPDNVPAGAMGLLSSALAHVDPSGQLGSAVAEGAETLARPDVTGTVTLFPGAEQDAKTIVLPVVNDSLTPSWVEGAGTRFGGVALSGKTVVRVVLVDKDLQTDDSIGTIELSGAELARAKGSGEPLVIDVSGQTSGQLQSVSVVVRKGE